MRLTIFRALITLLSGFVCATAGVDTRDRSIFQLQHIGWTAREGAPPRIYDIAQTTDGYLWLGTGSGLYSFDGVRFERYELHRMTKSGSDDISSLQATPDGGLWIGFRFGGISFLKGGKVTNYGEPEVLGTSSVYNMAVDQNGLVWAATTSGLVHLVGSRWQRIQGDWGFPGKSAKFLIIDRHGTLWVATEDTIVFLPRGEKVFHRTGEHVSLVLGMAEAPSGAIWVATTTGTMPVRQRSQTEQRAVKAGTPRTAWRTSPIPGGDGILFDHSGALWIASPREGVFRLRFPERFNGSESESQDIEKFGRSDGLTDTNGLRLAQDVEGNVWLGSDSGLDRFRATNVIPMPIPKGFEVDLAGGQQGNDWTGLVWSPERSLIHTPQHASFSYPFFNAASCVYRNTNGVVWLGIANGRSLWRFADGRLVQVPLPKGIVTGFDIQAMTEDHAGNLWLSIVRNGIFRLTNGVWASFRELPYLPNERVNVLMTDTLGRVWFGYPETIGIAVLNGSAVRTFSMKDGLEVEGVNAFYEHAGRVWIGGRRGLALFDGGRIRMLPADGPAFSGITGIVETETGDLWLNAISGIVHVPAEEVRRAAANGAHRVHYEIFDFLDGLQGTPKPIRPVPSVVETLDKRLWFVEGPHVFAQIDPSRLFRNAVPPPVLIRSIASDGTTYTSPADCRLPGGTRTLHIAYTALSYSVPQRVRFRYRLEGVDKGWQDAGTRREAFYTNLGPGRYTFRVIACNNDGIWNETGASLNFSIAPMYYQATWFLILSGAVTVASAAVAYHLRIRQITAAMNTRFDERLAERTRIARDFHDTLLQTMQGSKMVADDALDHPDDAVHMRNALVRLSGWLGQAIEEGRSALRSLRNSTTEKNDLAAALQRAGEECMFQRSVEFELSVDGISQDMHPIVRDEVYRIGYEAIRNSCVHSEASHVKVELSYVDDLVLCVRDDGKGIDPQIAQKGKQGHFGLIGMYERASRIRGKLSLSSSPSSGTEVELVVPRNIAFQNGNFGRIYFRRPW